MFINNPIFQKFINYHIRGPRMITDNHQTVSLDNFLIHPVHPNCIFFKKKMAPTLISWWKLCLVMIPTGQDQWRTFTKKGGDVISRASTATAVNGSDSGGTRAMTDESRRERKPGFSIEAPPSRNAPASLLTPSHIQIPVPSSNFTHESTLYTLHYRVLSHATPPLTSPMCLHVQTLCLSGTSTTFFRATTYENALHPNNHVQCAFMLHRRILSFPVAGLCETTRPPWFLSWLHWLIFVRPSHTGQGNHYTLRESYLNLSRLPFYAFR